MAPQHSPSGRHPAGALSPSDRHDHAPSDGRDHAPSDGRGDAPFGAHDHGRCRDDGLAAAEAHCRDHDLRLTPARRRALELLLSSHRAMGAYEVLEGLAADGLGSQPPAAYRALDFLTQNGLAHRIERLNAYVACPHPQHAHNPAFLICRSCRAVQEAASATARTALSQAAGTSGFQIEGLVIEAIGLCPACATPSGQTPTGAPDASAAMPGGTQTGAASASGAPAPVVAPSAPASDRRA